MAKRIGPQCKAAEYEDLSGEKSLTLDRIGRLCWSCFTIVEMSCNRDSESDRVFLGEGISFVDRESLSWAKLGHPCRV